MGLESKRTLSGKETFEGRWSNLWMVVHWQEVESHVVLLDAEREKRPARQGLHPPVPRLVDHTGQFGDMRTQHALQSGPREQQVLVLHEPQFNALFN